MSGAAELEGREEGREEDLEKEKGGRGAKASLRAKRKIIRSKNKKINEKRR